MSSTAVSIDIVQLVERLINVERENKDLRAEIQRVEKAASEALEEATGQLWDYTATLDETTNTLKFETGNEAGDRVFAHVAVVNVEMAKEQQ